MRKFGNPTNASNARFANGSANGLPDQAILCFLRHPKSWLIFSFGSILLMKIPALIVATTALIPVYCTHISICASPAPLTSDYFRTNAAGFIVEHKGAGAPEIIRYGMGFIIIKQIVTPLYVRTRLENPADPVHPLIVDSVIHPGAKSFAFDSPPLSGLKTGRKYKVEILVFDSPSRTHEISRHVGYAQFF